MPAYYNPNNFYPATYPMAYNSSMLMPQPQMQLSTAPASNVSIDLMTWVDGEVGAKAFQRPNGWPSDKPIPLWDSTDTVIWLKSWNSVGIPNPMQKLKYEMPEQQPMLPQGQSGNTSTTTYAAANEPTNYVTKTDFEQMKTELMNLLRNNQNGNQQRENVNQNRGGNK